MMGTKARTFAPVAVLSLEDLVPHTHFYRHLNRVLDLSFVRDLVKETYAGGGRPSNPRAPGRIETTVRR